MPIVIKEMHVRTVVEKRIITEADVSEELLRKIEDRVSCLSEKTVGRQPPPGGIGKRTKDSNT